jgi:ankyrin repeat protein
MIIKNDSKNSNNPLIINLNRNMTNTNNSNIKHLIETGNLNELKKLINKKNVDDSIAGTSCWNLKALSHAIERNNLEIVRYLLEVGANPNVDDTDSLFCAVDNKNKDMMKLLIKYGANINAIDCEDKPVINCVAFDGDEGMVQILLDAGVALHVENTPDEVTGWNREPVFWAVQNPNAKVLQLLLKAGANPFATDAINRAAYNENPKIIWMLMWARRYQKIDEVDDEDLETPLLTAAQFNDNPQVVGLLLKYGADPYICDGVNGHSVCHHAVLGNKMETLKLLLSYGDDKVPFINIVNNDNYTPMEFAIVCNSIPMVLLLCKAGAEMDLDKFPEERVDIILQIRKVCYDQIYEICNGFQNQDLPALQLLEIVDESNPNMVYFTMYQKWRVITTVKHFHDRQKLKK